MRSLGKIFLFIIVMLVISSVACLGFMGFIPGLSTLLGANIPRDLGIKFTEANRQSARDKSQIIYDSLPDSVPAEQSFQTSGTRTVNTQFSSSEMTALLNNRPWKYYPYKNVQVKFNADGTGEISGSLIKSKIPGYGAKIGTPKEAIDFAMKFLPENPTFYVKKDCWSWPDLTWLDDDKR